MGNPQGRPPTCSEPEGLIPPLSFSNYPAQDSPGPHLSEPSSANEQGVKLEGHPKGWICLLTPFPPT